MQGGRQSSPCRVRLGRPTRWWANPESSTPEMPPVPSDLSPAVRRPSTGLRLPSTAPAALAGPRHLGDQAPPGPQGPAQHRHPDGARGGRHGRGRGRPAWSSRRAAAVEPRRLALAGRLDRIDRHRRHPDRRRPGPHAGRLALRGPHVRERRRASRTDRRTQQRPGQGGGARPVQGPRGRRPGEPRPRKTRRPSPRRCSRSSASASSQMSCLIPLWMGESGWRVNAENSSSGAYGIPQALPGSKMATAGADWQTNAGHPDRVGPGLHPGALRLTVRRLGLQAGPRLVLTAPVTPTTRPVPPAAR